jgi:YfiH family protein
LKAFDAGDFELAFTRQVHSAKVVRARRKRGILEYSACGPAPEQVWSAANLEADALVTNECGLLLAIRTADCLPILVADPQRGAIAAIHAGWRGALGGIVENTVREMKRTFDSAPRDLLVALGPSIRACCYVVGREVVDAFCGRFTRAEKFFCEQLKEPPAQSMLPSLSVERPTGDAPANPSWRLDLVAAALDQLERAGVPRSQIQVSDLCTSCRTDLFFSYRKEGAATGRMLAVMGRRTDSGPGAYLR